MLRAKSDQASLTANEGLSGSVSMRPFKAGALAASSALGKKPLVVVTAQSFRAVALAAHRP